MELYKKCTVKEYSLLVIDATLLSDNPLRFRKNLLQEVLTVIIIISDKIRDRNKYEYLRDKYCPHDRIG